MRRSKLRALVFVAIGAVVVFAVFRFVAGRGEPRGVAMGPRIAFEQSRHDLGQVDNLFPVRNQFVIVNQGDVPLRLGGVRTSCGCVSAQLSEQTIEPRSRGALRVVFDPRGVRGSRTEHIAVQTNDPQRPVVVFTVTALATEHIRLAPSKVVFEGVHEDSVASRDIDLTIVDPDAVIKVTRAESDSANVRVRAETISEGRHYVLHVSLQPPWKVGAFNATITVGTDSERYRQLTIPVKVRVVGELAYWPPQIVLGAGHPADEEVIVYVGPGKLREFSIVDVVPPDPSAVTKIYDLKDSGYAVGVRNLDPRKVHGKVIRITTTAIGMRHIVIPFVSVPSTPVER